MIFAAGLCSEQAGLEELEMRRYTIALLSEFFRQKGRELKVPDYNRMLKRTFQHIHRYISEKWSEQNLQLDLAVVIANTTGAFAARSGSSELFIFREGEARAVFPAQGGGAMLLGSDSDQIIEVEEAQLQPGDIAVLCDPVVSKVIGPRDVSLILRRASDPAKASLFLSAIADRKGAESPFTALIWEMPNYQGAAMLTEEGSSAKAPEEDEQAREIPGEDSPAEMAKKQWLSKWRRRKE